MKKKKKFIIPLSVMMLLCFLVFNNIEKANAGSGMCTYQAIYYYNEGIDGTATGIGTTTNNTSWQDGTGSSQNAENASYEVRNMTAQDCEKYMGVLNQGGIGTSCSYDPDGSGTCGDEHVNSGSYETGKNVDSSSFNSIVESYGGCQGFVDSTIKATDIDIKDNGYNSESGKNQDEMTRTYDYDTGKAITDANGQLMKYSAQTVIKTWTAPCNEKIDEPEKPEECKCSVYSGGGSGGSTMSTCGGTKVNTLTKCAEGSFTSGNYSSPENDACGLYSVTWAVNVRITEVINVSVNINPERIYAGGGVGISVKHSSSVSSSMGKVCVSSSERSPYCSGDATFVYNSGNPSQSYCEEKYLISEGETYSCERWVCDFNNTNCKFVEDTCRDAPEYGYKEVAFSCSYVYSKGGAGSADTSRAQSEASAAASALAKGSLSIEPITIFARQSNDENDTEMYDLSGASAPYQGAAITKGTDGFVSEEEKKNDTSSLYENGADSVGIANSSSSVVNQACINIYTSKVRYIKDGSCSDKEISGGNRYYIPLKYPHEKDHNVKNFVFQLKSSNISNLVETKLDTETNCGVNVYRDFYTKDVPPKTTYEFVYRPVDITTPVSTVFPNREEGSNWTTLYNTANGVDGDYDLAMKRDKTEYQVTLTPELIQTIKNINDANENNNMTYNSLYTISSEGKSTLLSEMGISIESGRYYNRLGECNRKKTTITYNEDGTVRKDVDPILSGTECW